MASSDKPSVKRELCPYKETCYRVRPIHFSEMSHPHLEKLVMPQLSSTITIPARLDFEVPDRERLLNQLKIVQKVLKDLGFKEDESSASPSSNDSSDGNVADASSSSSETKKRTSLSKDLKEKVERNKQAAKHRRETKLREMDKAAAVASSSRTSRQRNFARKRSSDSDDIQIVGEKKSKIDSSSSSSSSSSASNSSSESTFANQIRTCQTSEDREKLRDQVIAQMRQRGMKVSLPERGQFALKHALAAPYYLFFTRVADSRPTHEENLTVAFSEILDRSLGEIESSIHINFMVQLGWLTLQYLIAGQKADMQLVIGELCDMQDSQDKIPPNIKVYFVPKTNAYGIHHSKVSMFKYKDGGVRIVVSTANLYGDDWENRTQGLWISPHLPPLPSTALPTEGDSPTGFKRDFLKYLSHYDHKVLLEWVQLIRGTNCSAINVFFVGSVPGAHKEAEMYHWGHKKVARILCKNAVLPPDAPQWPLIAQSSSIGSLGPSVSDWITTDILSSMSQEKNKGVKSLPSFKFIYPSIMNYKSSFDCKAATSCLPYSMKTHSKQEWLNNHLHQWKSDKIHRTKAMPHIKSYTRVSPNLEEIPWFILTSANLSKAAWGRCQKSMFILNHEAGIIFLPRLIINKDTFPIKEQISPDIPVFPMPYDLPLTKYTSEDSPFVQEFFF